jgi:hypothetical protein
VGLKVGQVGGAGQDLEAGGGCVRPARRRGLDSRPNQIWMWDGTKFRRCAGSAWPVDVVSRYWIDHLLTPS